MKNRYKLASFQLLKQKQLGQRQKSQDQRNYLADDIRFQQQSRNANNKLTHSTPELQVNSHVGGIASNEFTMGQDLETVRELYSREVTNTRNSPIPQHFKSHDIVVVKEQQSVKNNQNPAIDSTRSASKQNDDLNLLHLISAIDKSTQNSQSSKQNQQHHQLYSNHDTNTTKNDSYHYLKGQQFKHQQNHGGLMPESFHQRGRNVTHSKWLNKNMKNSNQNTKNTTTGVSKNSYNFSNQSQATKGGLTRESAASSKSIFGGTSTLTPIAPLKTTESPPLYVVSQNQQKQEVQRVIEHRNEPPPTQSTLKVSHFQPPTETTQNFAILRQNEQNQQRQLQQDLMLTQQVRDEANSVSNNLQHSFYNRDTELLQKGIRLSRENFLSEFIGIRRSQQHISYLQCPACSVSIQIQQTNQNGNHGTGLQQTNCTNCGTLFQTAPAQFQATSQFGTNLNGQHQKSSCDPFVQIGPTFDDGFSNVSCQGKNENRHPIGRDRHFTQRPYSQLSAQFMRGPYGVDQGNNPPTATSQEAVNNNLTSRSLSPFYSVDAAQKVQQNSVLQQNRVAFRVQPTQKSTFGRQNRHLLQQSQSSCDKCGNPHCFEARRSVGSRRSTSCSYQLLYPSTSQTRGQNQRVPFLQMPAGKSPIQQHYSSPSQTQEILILNTERTPPTKASRPSSNLQNVSSPITSENRLSQIDLRCRVNDLYIAPVQRQIVEEDSVLITETEPTPKKMVEIQKSPQNDNLSHTQQHQSKPQPQIVTRIVMPKRSLAKNRKPWKNRPQKISSKNPAAVQQNSEKIVTMLSSRSNQTQTLQPNISEKQIQVHIADKQQIKAKTIQTCDAQINTVNEESPEKVEAQAQTSPKEEEVIIKPKQGIAQHIQTKPVYSKDLHLSLVKLNRLCSILCLRASKNARSMQNLPFNQIKEYAPIFKQPLQGSLTTTKRAYIEQEMVRIELYKDEELFEKSNEILKIVEEVVFGKNSLPRQGSLNLLTTSDQEDSGNEFPAKSNRSQKVESIDEHKLYGALKEKFDDILENYPKELNNKKLSTRFMGKLEIQCFILSDTMQTIQILMKEVVPPTIELPCHPRLAPFFKLMDPFEYVREISKDEQYSAPESPPISPVNLFEEIEQSESIEEADTNQVTIERQKEMRIKEKPLHSIPKYLQNSPKPTIEHKMESLDGSEGVADSSGDVILSKSVERLSRKSQIGMKSGDRQALFKKLKLGLDMKQEDNKQVSNRQKPDKYLQIQAPSGIFSGQQSPVSESDMMIEEKFVKIGIPNAIFSGKLSEISDSELTVEEKFVKIGIPNAIFSNKLSELSDSELTVEEKFVKLGIPNAIFSGELSDISDFQAIKEEKSCKLSLPKAFYCSGNSSSRYQAEDIENQILEMPQPCFSDQKSDEEKALYCNEEEHIEIEVVHEDQDEKINNQTPCVLQKETPRIQQAQREPRQTVPEELLNTIQSQEDEEVKVAEISINFEDLSEGKADQNPIEIQKNKVQRSARDSPLHQKIAHLEEEKVEKDQPQTIKQLVEFPNDVTKVDSDIEISDVMAEPSDEININEDCDVPSERENLGTSENSREERPRVQEIHSANWNQRIRLIDYVFDEGENMYDEMTRFELKGQKELSMSPRHKKNTPSNPVQQIVNPPVQQSKPQYLQQPIPYHSQALSARSGSAFSQAQMAQQYEAKVYFRKLNGKKSDEGVINPIEVEKNVLSPSVVSSTLNGGKGRVHKELKRIGGLSNFGHNSARRASPTNNASIISILNLKNQRSSPKSHIERSQLRSPSPPRRAAQLIPPQSNRSLLKPERRTEQKLLNNLQSNRSDLITVKSEYRRSTGIKVYKSGDSGEVRHETFESRNASKIGQPNFNQEMSANKLQKPSNIPAIDIDQLTIDELNSLERTKSEEKIKDDKFSPQNSDSLHSEDIGSPSPKHSISKAKSGVAQLQSLSLLKAPQDSVDVQTFISQNVLFCHLNDLEQKKNTLSSLNVKGNPGEMLTKSIHNLSRYAAQEMSQSVRMGSPNGSRSRSRATPARSPARFMRSPRGLSSDMISPVNQNRTAYHINSSQYQSNQFRSGSRKYSPSEENSRNQTFLPRHLNQVIQEHAVEETQRNLQSKNGPNISIEKLLMNTEQAATIEHTEQRKTAHFSHNTIDVVDQRLSQFLSGNHLQNRESLLDQTDGEVVMSSQSAFQQYLGPRSSNPNQHKTIDNSDVNNPRDDGTDENRQTRKSVEQIDDNMRLFVVSAEPVANENYIQSANQAQKNRSKSSIFRQSPANKIYSEAKIAQMTSHSRAASGMRRPDSRQNMGYELYMSLQSAMPINIDNQTSVTIDRSRVFDLKKPQISDVVPILSMKKARPIDKQSGTFEEAATAEKPPKIGLATLDAQIGNTTPQTAQNLAKLFNSENPQKLSSLNHKRTVNNFNEISRPNQTNEDKSLSVPLTIEENCDLEQSGESWAVNQFSKTFGFVESQARQNQVDEDEIDINLKQILKDYLKAQKQALQKSIFASGDQQVLSSRRSSDRGGESDQNLQTYIDLLSAEQLDEMLKLLVPIVKLGPNKYLVGTKQRQIFMRGNVLIIRVGGGFESFKTQVANEAKTECLKLFLDMEKTDSGFIETVVNYLQKAKASEKVIHKFVKEASLLNIPFAQVMKAIKQREGRLWEERKSLLAAQMAQEKSQTDEMQQSLSDNLSPSRQRSLNKMNDAGKGKSLKLSFVGGELSPEGKKQSRSGEKSSKNKLVTNDKDLQTGFNSTKVGSKQRQEANFEQL